MRRIIGILTLLALMALPAGDSYAAESAIAATTVPCCERIEDRVRDGVEALADMLQECRFELPQSGYTALSRQGKQQQASRRINDSNKAGEPQYQQHGTLIHSTYAIACRTAVATSRHSRGYYIYALRHIII